MLFDNNYVLPKTLSKKEILWAPSTTSTVMGQQVLIVTQHTLAKPDAP